MELWNLLGVGAVGLWVGGMLALSRLPETSLSRPLRAFAASAAVWAAGDLVAANATDFIWKQIGVAILYSGAIFVPPLWWLVAVRRTEDLGVSPFLQGRRWTIGPLLFAAVMWVAMLTNPWHGKFIVPVLGAQNGYGPLWWALAIPSWVLIFGVFALEAKVMLRVRDSHVRRQAGFMILAGGLMLGAHWLYVSGAARGMNATLPVMATSGAILVVGMLREGLFGVLPIALPVIATHDPDGLLVVRPDGRLIHANPRARTTLSPVVLAVGLPFLETLARRLRHADGQPLSRVELDWEQRWWGDVLQSGGALYRYGEDGERRLRMSAQPVYGRGQRLLAYCLRVHDATEEQCMQAALIRARRLESTAEVALGVAADFNNLLAVVRGNAALLADRLPTTPDIQRKLHRILRSADQAGDLAKQLELYAGAGEPRRESLDLRAVVVETLEAFDPELSPDSVGVRARIDLRTNLEPATAEADAIQLCQLVLDLLVNARDALGERGGEIRVTTGQARLDPAHMSHLVLGEGQPAGQFGYVRVADTGAGLDLEGQERIFEPFFSTKGKHRGIGLAAVFGIARSHDALLQLESQAGRGATFSVYFPTAARG